MVLLDPELEQKYTRLVESDYLLPIKISDFYAAKVREEIDTMGSGGPLYRTVLPVGGKINLALDGEGRDYINEKHHSPVDGVNYIVQKYEDRLIFLVSDECFAHCQYCFRTYKLQSERKDGAGNKLESIEEKTAILIRYLQDKPEIKEVILTGGDPLVLCPETLHFIFEQLKRWKLRVHTRALVYAPQTFNATLIKVLKKYNVKLVFHINHPYEICRDVREKIILLRNNAIKMYAQFPLLRGINDHALVLNKLLGELAELHVRPLSIFCVEPNRYSAAYRIHFKRIEKILDTLNWSTPSWINSFRFVLDTEIGKVRRENIICRERESIIFSREGREVLYRDFPIEYDTPGDIQKLLWQNKNSPP
jgi:lysine 2,3-aminomutase